MMTSNLQPPRQTTVFKSQCERRGVWTCMASDVAATAAQQYSVAVQCVGSYLQSS